MIKFALVFLGLVYAFYGGVVRSFIRQAPINVIVTRFLVNSPRFNRQIRDFPEIETLSKYR